MGASTVAPMRRQRENHPVEAAVPGVPIGALPCAMLVVGVLAEIGAIVLSWGLEPWTDTAIYAAYATVIIGAGALVASKYRANPIG